MNEGRLVKKYQKKGSYILYVKDGEDEMNSGTSIAPSLSPMQLKIWVLSVKWAPCWNIIIITIIVVVVIVIVITTTWVSTKVWLLS